VHFGPSSLHFLFDDVGPNGFLAGASPDRNSTGLPALLSPAVARVVMLCWHVGIGPTMAILAVHAVAIKAWR